MSEVEVVEAYAPGRVNLVGDHTDYAGGLVLPMAVDRGTTVRITWEPGGRRLELTSADAAGVAAVDLDAPDPLAGASGWARVVAAVAALVGLARGGRGLVTTTLPVGAGLSSSSALSVALALALGLGGFAGFADGGGDTGSFSRDQVATERPRTGTGRPADESGSFSRDQVATERPRTALVRAAEICRRAEELATGVPCGIMDQLTALAGRRGHLLLIDCGRLSWEEVPLPRDAQVVVVHSGEPRTLAGSEYAARRAACEEAAALVGPLAAATSADLAAIHDPTLRRRARHVVTENARVRAAAEAMRAGDLAEVGRLMTESHRSLAEDFEVSTPALDRLVEALRRIPGVAGARLTGAGFGGCAVALAHRSELRRDSVPGRHWLVEATDGARRTITGG